LPLGMRPSSPTFFVVLSQMLFFGILLGYIFGLATRFCLRFVYNDRFVEGTLIIGMSYLCFWLGELVVGTSAVIAVVFMGLYMNWHKSALSPEVLHYMHQFYEMIAHILNTLIFAIAGTKLGALLGTYQLREILVLYWGQILAIYPIVLLTRFVAIALFFPLLSRIGTKCTWQDAVVMWWGGLRGSVGLALALVIDHTTYDANQWGDGPGAGASPVDGTNVPPLNCRDQPQIALLMTVVVVTGTVIINGITMMPLMNLLKLTTPSQDRRFQLNTAYLQLRKKTEKYLTVLQEKQAAHAGADWDYVQKNMVKHTKLFHDIDDHDRAAWMAVLCIERASYLAQFEAGMLSDTSFELLEGFMATVTAEAATVPTTDLSKLYDRLFDEMLVQRLDKSEQPSLTVKKAVYEIYLAYTTAQEEAQEVMRLFKETVVVQRKAARRHSLKKESTGDLHVPAELHSEDEENDDEADKDEQAVCYNALAVVKSEHDDNIVAMEMLFKKMEAKCITTVARDELRDWKSRHALMMMLLKQRHHVEHMVHQGVLTDLDAAPLLDECNSKLGKLQIEPLKEYTRESISFVTTRVPGNRAAMKVMATEVDLKALRSKISLVPHKSRMDVESHALDGIDDEVEASVTSMEPSTTSSTKNDHT